MKELIYKFIRRFFPVVGATHAQNLIQHQQRQELIYKFIRRFFPVVGATHAQNLIEHQQRQGNLFADLSSYWCNSLTKPY